MAEEGLRAEVGITLDKLTRQLAAAEARMVKTARKMEGDFTRANRGVEKSFNQVSKATSGLTGSGGLRMMSMQLSQVAQQGAATGQWARAFSIQIADMALILGPMGILIGAAAAALGPFIIEMLGASDATDKLIDSLIGGQVSLDSVRGSISQLRDLQEAYTDAIEASAGASAATAGAVAANSKREFEARKQVLAVELELLRIRGREQRSGLQNLQEAARREAESAVGSTTAGIAGGGYGNIDPSLRQYVNTGPRTVVDVVGETFLDRNEERRLAIRKLRAEIELTELAAEEAATALNGDFLDVGGSGGGAASGGGSGGGRRGGGGGGRSTPASEKVREVNEQLKVVVITADQAASGFSDAFADIITGSKDARDALSQLASQWARMLAQSAGNQIFGTIFGGAPKGLGALFGGGRSSGGPVQPGRIYAVNEGQPGTEYFAPSVPGRILPRGPSSGGAAPSPKVHVIPSPYFDVVVDNRARGVAVPMIGNVARAERLTYGSRAQNYQRRGTS